MNQTIEPRVLEILQSGQRGPGFFRLPDGQLDRPTYDKVNKVLTNLGAKWDKKSRTHVEGTLGSLDRLDDVLASGKSVNIQQETQFFPTPALIVARLLELARLESGMRVLEPSAGLGTIALPIVEIGCEVIACELNFKMCDTLKSYGGNLGVIPGDFLELEPMATYDRVVMNPPFTRGSDVKHVTHARRFLKPGGLLVSVMSVGWQNNSDKASQEFREIVARDGRCYMLPAESFKASGTNIPTCIVVLPGVSK